jgi:hypothetical protein
MAGPRLEPSKFLDLVGYAPVGVIEDFVEELPPFSRSRKEWKAMLRQRVCPLCGESVLEGEDESFLSTPGAYVLHVGECEWVGLALAISDRLPRRRRTFAEWRRRIDAVWRAGLTRPAPDVGTPGDQADPSKRMRSVREMVDEMVRQAVAEALERRIAEANP